jgi:hypothetical protein
VRPLMVLRCMRYSKLLISRRCHLSVARDCSSTSVGGREHSLIRLGGRARRICAACQGRASSVRAPRPRLPQHGVSLVARAKVEEEIAAIIQEDLWTQLMLGARPAISGQHSPPAPCAAGCSGGGRRPVTTVSACGAGPRLAVISGNGQVRSRCNLRPLVRQRLHAAEVRTASCAARARPATCGRSYAHGVWA